MLTAARTEALLKTFPRLTIGLVGDLWLERVLLAAAPDLEAEFTSAAGLAVERTTNMASVLGTTLRSLSALGVGLLVPVSVLGDDGHGFELLREMRRLPVDPAHLLCWSDRVTPTTSTLCVAHPEGGYEPLQRYEVRSRMPLADNATATVCEHLRAVFQSSDGLIVQDHVWEDECGVVNEAVRKTLHNLATSSPRKRIVVMSRTRPFDFPHSTVFLPTPATIVERKQAAVFVGRSSTTVCLAKPGEYPHPAMAAAEPEAGLPHPEQGLAALTAALLAGAPDEEAAQFASLVAAQAGEQPGLVRPAQLLARCRASSVAT